MDLTILGASASFPAPGDACSGFLLRDGETRLLIDCGSGTLSRLVTEIDLAELSAIVITHFHPDHFLDLIPMRYGLRYGMAAVAPLPLFLPPGGRDYLRGVGQAMRSAPGMFEQTFAIAEYDPSGAAGIGEFELRFQRTTHDIPTWAVSVQGIGRFVYSADTQACPELETFAAGADLFLCESTYPADAGDLPSDNHLTSIEAGRLAQRAGVGRLVLTHFWPSFARDRFRPGAEVAFAGPVTLAEAGLRLTIAKSIAPDRNPRTPNG